MKQFKTRTMLGERLKEIREKKGVSIEEVAKVTKINRKYLQALEDGEYQKLPSEVYAKGFLRSYSNFLGVEVEDVLKIYKREQGEISNFKKEEDLKKGRGHIVKLPKLPRVTFSFRSLFVFCFILLFVGVVGYFYVEAGKFAETPRLLISHPLPDSVVKKHSVEVAGRTDIGNQVSINRQNIFVNDRGEFKEEVALKEGMNKLMVVAINKFNKKTERELDVMAEYNRKLPEKPVKDIKKEQQKNEGTTGNLIRVAIKANGSPVWLAVKVDGKKVYSGTMLADTEQLFEGKNEVVVTSGMASKTLIKVDGEEEYHILADVPGVIRDVVFKNENDANNQEGNFNNKEENENGVDTKSQTNDLMSESGGN